MLVEIHRGFAWFVICGNGLAGIWALAAHYKSALRTRALWWFVLIVQLAIFVQVALGVTATVQQGIDAPSFHKFYGFVAIIAVAIIYSYRAQMEQWRYLLYGYGGLFLMGLGIRAMLLS